jgi:hypothetical protein
MQSLLRKHPKYEAILMIGCVVFFVLTGFFLKIFLSPHSRTLTWENVGDNTPKSLIEKVLSIGFTSKVDQKSIKVIRIPSQGAGTLYIFDFRSSQLCGVGGCIYPVYHESGKLLLQLIANPHLPPQEKLIQVADIVRQGFPCLVVTQNTTTQNMVSRSLYCYQGDQYVRFNEILTSAGVNFDWSERKQ